MNKKNILVIIIVLLLITIFGIGLTYYLFIYKSASFLQSEIQISTEKQKEQETQHQPCLADNEQATYLTRGTGSFVPTLPLTILIQDKETKNEKFRFEIPDVRVSEAYPLNNLMYKCNLYVVRMFNFDIKNLKTLSDFRKEIWKYQYSGEEEKILTLSYKDKKGIDYFFYSDDFRIDQTESYIALIKSWYGEPENHALVVKNLKTMEDKYVITLKQLTEKFPDVDGAISLGWWGGDEFISFYLITPERPFFRFYLKSGEIEIFR